MRLPVALLSLCPITHDGSLLTIIYSHNLPTSFTGPPVSGCGWALAARRPVVGNMQALH